MTYVSPASAVQLPVVSLPITESADQIFDMIMGQIEPELVTASLPTLKETYKDETPEQKTQRGERYKKAFDRYDEEFAKFQSLLDQKVHQYRKHAFQEEEEKNHASDEHQLASIESSINEL